MKGDRVAIGEYNATSEAGVTGAGAVYIYDRDERAAWSETRITALDRARNSYFGFRVAVDGPRVAVAAIGVRQNEVRRGVVYVYDDDGAGGFTERRLVAESD